MFMPAIMIIMIFGMAPLLTYTQEAPVTNDVQTEEQITVQETASEETTKPSTEEIPTSTQEETKEQVEKQETPSEPENTPKETTQDFGAIERPSSNAEETTQEIVVGAEPINPPNEQLSVTSENVQTTTETPEIPEAPKLEEQETLIPEEEEINIEEEPTGIDTVSMENPQGNWLFKRIWWERAEERYGRIRVMVDSIWESRNKFFYERTQLDRNTLDPFYMNIGIDRGELQIILSEISDFLEKQREQGAELSEQERMLYEEEETLKQLKTDIDMITNLDHAIDDALGTFMNQINRVRNYESEAWKNFTEIARILNDTRARELYYMIEGAARNIKTISTYLEQDFFNHFNKLVTEAKTRVARVQSQMEALKEKGVLFQRQAEQLEQQAAQENKEEEEEIVKPKPKLGWIDWISSGLSSFFDTIWSIIRLPYDMLFGK